MKEANIGDMAKYVADELKGVEEHMKKVEQDEARKTPVLPPGSVGDAARAARAKAKDKLWN